MGKRSLALAALAVAGAQGGHLVAYQVRFGAAAMQVQSSGAHAYFPTALKVGLGAAALIALAMLLIVGVARIAGRGVARAVPGGPSFVGLLAWLFTLQLSFFVAQEVVESLAAGAVPDSPAHLLLWGMAGQLPVALVGAAALCWLWTKVAPAAEALVSVLRVERTATPIAPAVLTPVVAAVDMRAALVANAERARIVKRGPPSLLPIRTF